MVHSFSLILLSRSLPYDVIQIEALYTYFYQVLGRALYIRSEGQLDRI